MQCANMVVSPRELLLIQCRLCLEKVRIAAALFLIARSKKNELPCTSFLEVEKTKAGVEYEAFLNRTPLTNAIVKFKTSIDEASKMHEKLTTDAEYSDTSEKLDLIMRYQHQHHDAWHRRRLDEFLLGDGGELRRW